MAGPSPEKEEIARRYLKFQPSLLRKALARLVVEEKPVEAEAGEAPGAQAEDALERPMSLHEQRLGAVAAVLRAAGARRVLDLGCGEGKLLRLLLKDKSVRRRSSAWTCRSGRSKSRANA